MKDYQNLYLKCDALLLTNVFEKFEVKIGAKNYGLHPLHYFSASALSWDAMVSMTKVELDLISEVTMYLFLKKEKGV